MVFESGNKCVMICLRERVKGSGRENIHAWGESGGEKSFDRKFLSIPTRLPFRIVRVSPISVDESVQQVT